MEGGEKRGKMEDRRPAVGGSINRGKPCLFADFVSGNSVELLMPFDRDYLISIRIDGMLLLPSLSR